MITLTLRAVRTDAKPAAPMPAPTRLPANSLYLRLLTWSFTLFNSVRVFAYLPTIWAIQQHGASDQHSLLTWITFAGANLSMALWLFEQNGRRVHRAVIVNAGNALMCTAIVLVIASQRLGH